MACLGDPREVVGIASTTVHVVESFRYVLANSLNIYTPGVSFTAVYVKIEEIIVSKCLQARDVLNLC